MRDFVRGWMAERPERTLVLTTHYMMEADELCDRVAVVDRGKVLACDTPAALKRRMQCYPVFELVLTPGGDDGWQKVGSLPGVHQCVVTPELMNVHVKVILEEEAAVGAVVQRVVNCGCRIQSLEKVEPTLEEVFIQLVGRGLSRAFQAALGVVLSLVLGLILLPELRLAWGRHPGAWGWLMVYLAEGTVMLVALGLLLAATVLNLPRHGMFLSEGVAGLLYLLSGAVFPTTVLPAWLRPVSLALPPTYWLEGMRRALLGPSEIPTALSGWGHAQLASALLLSTLGLVAVAHFFFCWSERRAWRAGNFDKATGY
jgi:hypothetical protein